MSGIDARKRIAHIDGLRAVAALSVVVFHAGVHAADRADPTSPLGLFVRSGAHGVDLFFVLSGFCLSYPFLVAKYQTGKLDFCGARFAARRIVRIVPPYYAAIVLFLVIGSLLKSGGVALPASMDPLALSPVEVLKQMLFVGRHFLANPFWTLALEFRWYFLFPLALWLWMRSRALFAAVALLSLVTGESTLHSYDLFFLPVFMLGIVAADLYVRGEQRARIAIIALPVAVALAVLSTAHDGWDFTDRGPLPMWGIAAFCLVVAAGSWPFARKVLSNRAAVLMGVMSYSIYLIHEPVIEFTQRLAGNASMPLFVTTCSAVVAGVAFSLVAEQPFLEGRLKNVMVQRLQRWFSRAVPDIHAGFTGSSSKSEQRAPEAAELLA